MPSRITTILIALFWLATLGWLGYRDLYPRLFPGEVPPFVIELEDELTSQLTYDPTRTADVLWVVYRNDKDVGKVKTSLRYVQADNSFELYSRVIQLRLATGLIQIEIPEMTTSYRLSRQGELQGMRLDGKMDLNLDAMKLGSYAARATFEGDIVGDKMNRSAIIYLPFSKEPVRPQLEPIGAPKGTFLNPLHPVPRIKGLKPGRKWRMELVDPLAGVVEPALLAIQEQFRPGKNPIKFTLPAAPKYLDAEVLTETAPVFYNAKEHECFVIEYRGQDEVLRTYVRVSDGWVLRQESRAFGELIVLQR